MEPEHRVYRVLGAVSTIRDEHCHIATSGPQQQRQYANKRCAREPKLTIACVDRRELCVDVERVCKRAREQKEVGAKGGAERCGERRADCSREGRGAGVIAICEDG